MVNVLSVIEVGEISKSSKKTFQNNLFKPSTRTKVLFFQQCAHLFTRLIPIVIPAGYILRLDPMTKWRLTYETRVFVPWVAFTLTRA
jgi:hypothetical protein